MRSREAASRRGANVILVSGPTALEAPAGVHLIDVRTAEEMRAAVADQFADCSIGIFAAAVADYRPAKKHAGENEEERRAALTRATGADRRHS